MVESVVATGRIAGNGFGCDTKVRFGAFRFHRRGRSQLSYLSQLHYSDSSGGVPPEFPNRVFADLQSVLAQLEEGLPRLASDRKALRSLTAWPWIVRLNLNAQ